MEEGNVVECAVTELLSVPMSNSNCVKVWLALHEERKKYFFSTEAAEKSIEDQLYDILCIRLLQDAQIIGVNVAGNDNQQENE